MAATKQIKISRPTAIRLNGIAVNLGGVAEAGKRRRFEMSAYSGEPVDTIFGRFVIDLAGLDAPAGRMPILRQHDPNRIVGTADEVAVDLKKGVTIRGDVSAVTADGAEVASLSDEGFPWQASVGVAIATLEDVRPGASVKVNGREFAGPGLIARKSKLNESSFVPLGADSNTSAVVLAAVDVTVDDPANDGGNAMPEPIAAPTGAATVVVPPVAPVTPAAPAGAALAAPAPTVDLGAQIAAAFAAAMPGFLAAVNQAVDAKLARNQGTAPVGFTADKGGGADPDVELRKQFKTDKAFELYKANLQKGNVRVLRGAPVVTA